MTPDELNPAICPAALEEDGTLDRTKWNGAHKWSPQLSSDDYHNPVYMCDECRAIKNQ